MHIAMNDVDVRMQIPGAVIRQQRSFGNVSGYGAISGEYFTLGRRRRHDAALPGLDGNHCHCPHWGFMLKGEITTTDAQGRQETVRKDDLFYWPPGHNVRVDADAEMIMFSPEHEHSVVIDHMIAVTGG
jgi:hypothetical protein